MLYLFFLFFKFYASLVFSCNFDLNMFCQVSYMILAKVSPVTHSVGNCVKRVVVIVTSVIFFRTPVSFINSLGNSLILVVVKLDQMYWVPVCVTSIAYPI